MNTHTSPKPTPLFRRVAEFFVALMFLATSATPLIHFYALFNLNRLCWVGFPLAKDRIRIGKCPNSKIFVKTLRATVDKFKQYSTFDATTRFCDMVLSRTTVMLAASEGLYIIC